MADIVVIGSLNMDVVISVPHIPVIGETILADGVNNYAGGKGANQAVAAARLGSDVAMIGKVGSDKNGESLLNSLRNEGIDISGIEISSQQTGIAFINVSSQGENNIVVYPGANADVDIEQIDRCKDIIKQSKICIVQLEIPYEVVKYTIEFCYENNIPVIFNPAPGNKEIDVDLLKKSYIVAPNETELKLLTLEGEDQWSIEEFAEKVHKDGCENLIVTLGENGSIYLNGNKTRYFKQKKVKAIDTTAAGDSFIGGLASGILEGKSLHDAIEYSSYVSALTVTKLGAQASLPTKKKVDEFIKKYKEN